MSSSLVRLIREVFSPETTPAKHAYAFRSLMRCFIATFLYVPNVSSVAKVVDPAMQITAPALAVSSRWESPTKPGSFRLPKQPSRNLVPLLDQSSDHTPRTPRRTFTPDSVVACVRSADPTHPQDHFAQDQVVRTEKSPRKPIRTVSRDGDSLFATASATPTAKRSTSCATKSHRRSTQRRPENV
jgi:hypothetical protein